MSAHDYRINAQVRRLLVRRWVDVSRLQIGTTNGIVYLIGVLDTVVDDHARTSNERSRMGVTSHTLKLIGTLEKEIRRLPSVRDVVFKIEQVCKQGGRWRTMGRVIPARGVPLVRPPGVRKPTERQRIWSLDEEGES